MESYIATSSLAIPGATAPEVWDALINPDIVKEYLFGTCVESDWKLGSPVTYSGVWEGAPYVDRGTIMEVVPEKKLVMSYWSAAFGPEIPENHKTVTYEITPTDGGTILTISQDNNKDEAERARSEQNWNSVLEKIKTLLEK